MMTPYHLIWKVHANVEDGEYFVAFELRDYYRNYIRSVPVNKEFLTNLIQAMALHEEKGLKYKGDGVGKFVMEGLGK